MSVTCSHLDQITDVEPITPNGCQECLAMGDEWVSLRMCMQCGHIGCCDSSKNKHATKHFESTDHPIVQIYDDEDDWLWCYKDEVQFSPFDIY